MRENESKVNPEYKMAAYSQVPSNANMLSSNIVV